MKSIKVTLLSYTPDPDKVVAMAARLCYSSDNIEDISQKLDSKQIDKLVNSLIEMGHESPVEHVSFTFGIEGVSRVLTHQLVRHRLASYSQKSQRYVKEDAFEYITPPSISGDPLANNIFHTQMEAIQDAYNALAILGIPKEDARYVLPNACETKIIVTMNARTLHNFFSQRLCNRAQWEIREMAKQMKEKLVEVSPLLFGHAGAPCETTGECNQGKYSCGKHGTQFTSGKRLEDYLKDTIAAYYKDCRDYDPEDEKK